MTAEEFKARFGVAPDTDDLVRVCCPIVGQTGHWSCGVCRVHDKPRFMCGCLAKSPLQARDGGAN